MNSPDDIKQLLTEIRDLQREQLSEYRRVTERSLALQQQAVNRQEQIGRIYKRALAVTGILIVGLLVLLLGLLDRL